MCEGNIDPRAVPGTRTIAPEWSYNSGCVGAMTRQRRRVRDADVTGAGSAARPPRVHRLRQVRSHDNHYFPFSALFIIIPLLYSATDLAMSLYT